jgi:hypothetical protein
MPEAVALRIEASRDRHVDRSTTWLRRQSVGETNRKEIGVTTTATARFDRRDVLVSLLVGAAAVLSTPGQAAARHTAFDRPAYDRYVRLMNAHDARFTDYYADDIKFEMNIRGKAGVLEFYQRQWAYVAETLEVLFFCSDATGAAAEVRSELRCVKDYDDTTTFGRALKVGEVQRVHGYVFYTLNPQGLVTQIKGPTPEVTQPWRFDAR